MYSHSSLKMICFVVVSRNSMELLWQQLPASFSIQALGPSLTLQVRVREAIRTESQKSGHMTIYWAVGSMSFSCSYCLFIFVDAPSDMIIPKAVSGPLPRNWWNQNKTTHPPDTYKPVNHFWIPSATIRVCYLYASKVPRFENSVIYGRMVLNPTSTPQTCASRGSNKASCPLYNIFATDWLAGRRCSK